MAVHPAGCSGTVSGALNGHFASCTVSVTQDVNDQILQLIPQGWAGDSISTFQIAIVVPKGLQPGTYATQMLGDGSVITIINRANAERFTAGAPNGPFVGTITLDVTSPAQNPGTDQTWADTHTHGTLSAQLPHDPDSAGSDADTVTLEASY
jgi:hypothetical protein